MKTYLRLVLMATLAAAIGSAEGAVHGTVFDPLGAEVRDAKVTLWCGETSVADAVTDGEGGFHFSSAPNGRCHVRVEAAGFSDYRGRDVFLGSGETAIPVVLEISPLRNEFVVSATGSEIPASQVGASVNLIDSQDIRSENKLDVLEDLRQIPGAQVLQTGQRGSATVLYLRGGESSFNKIMIDGVPANAIGGLFDFAQLSNTGVESVEVLRGANSVLYGADALAGVVNVATRRGTTSIPELSYSVDGGKFGTRNQSVALGGAFRQFDYFSAFSRFDTQGSYPNNFFHNATYAGNFGWDPNTATDLRVTYRRNWTDLGSPNALLVYGISDDSLQTNQNTYFSGTAQNQTTQRWHNLVRFAFGQFASVYTNPAPTGEMDPYGFGNYLGNPTTVRGANGFSATGQAILDYYGTYPQITPQYEARRSVYGQSDYRAFGDWIGTFGFRYEHEDGSGYMRDNYSYLMEAHGSIAHRLYVTGGVGLENNAVFGFAASPRVSAAYYLRKPSSAIFFGETRLRFNFGRGIKEPSTYQQGNQLYALLTPMQRSNFNVGRVGPERSRTFDFGIGQGLFQGRARLDVTYFQNRFYDLLTYLDTSALVLAGVNSDAASASGYGAYVNATSTKSKGMEVQVSSAIAHGFRVQANYTLLDAVVTKAFGTAAYNPDNPDVAIGAYAPLQGARPFRRARNSGSLGLIYAQRKWSGALTGSLVGRRDDSTFLSDAFFGNSLLLPNHDLDAGYQKFDLSGRYALNSYVALYTSMENLLSQHYQAAFGFPALPFSIRAGLTFTIGGENWRRR